MSAGGYCALNLGLRHRDLVSTIIDLSGATVPTHTGGAAALFPRPDAALLVAANSPASYASKLSPNPPTRIWLDSGSADKNITRQMSNLVPELQARGISATCRLRPGGHTYRVWTAAIREALPWALDSGNAQHDPSSCSCLGAVVP